MSEEFLRLGLVFLKSITLVLGCLITYFAFRAYSVTRAKPIGALSLGFGLITVGVVLAGVANELWPAVADELLFVEALVTASGFAVILYSLYTDW